MSDLNEIKKLQEEVQKNLTKTKGIGLFFTDKEKTFFTESGREITEDILQTSFLFYKIDLKKTRIHPLYGESKNKSYLPPIEIFGRINVEVNEPTYQAKQGITKKGFGNLTAHVYIEHLRELDLIERDGGNIIITSIKGGDFINYKGQFYRIYDDGISQISNQHSYGGDRRFYLTIRAIEVDEDVMKGR
jgi:hypothetical protein